MEEKVKEVFEEVMNIELENYSDLIQHDVDSLDFINILFKMDSELGIKISNEEITENELTVIENFIKFLKPKLAK